MNIAKQRKQRTRLIGIVAFLILVIISGFVLTATHNTDDPFVDMSDIVDMRQMLAETEQTDPSSPVGRVADNELALPEAAPAIHTNAINWSAGGEVLYDLWFMCATTAIVILCSYPIRWLTKQVSRKNRLSPTNRSGGEDPSTS